MTHSFKILLMLLCLFSLLPFSCGDDSVLSLFLYPPGVVTENLNVDFLIAMGTSNGLVIGTNINTFQEYSIPSGVIAVALDEFGDVYYSLNVGSGPNLAIAYHIGETWSTNSYNPNNFSIALGCDNSGWSYSLQANALDSPNQTGFNRMGNFLTTSGYMGSSPGISANIKTCLAVASGGLLVIGDDSGNINISSDHGNSFANSMAWEGGLSLDHVAVSPSGSIVIAHSNQLRNNIGAYNSPTITTTNITCLSFSGEVLFIGMPGAIGISSNYGETIITNSTIPGGETVVGGGLTKDGRIIAATDAANIYMDTNKDGTLNLIYDAAGTGNDASVIF